MGYPLLDPERGLKGATPGKLARALPWPRRRPSAERVREQDGQYSAAEEPGADAVSDRKLDPPAALETLLLLTVCGGALAATPPGTGGHSRQSGSASVS